MKCTSGSAFESTPHMWSYILTKYITDELLEILLNQGVTNIIQCHLYTIWMLNGG